jgi:hypothetical protein
MFVLIFMSSGMLLINIIFFLYMKADDVLMLLLQKPKNGDGPTLSNHDCCMDCVMVGANKVVSAGDCSDRKALFKNLAETALAGSCLDDPSHFVLRTRYVKCILLLISNLSFV